MIRGNPNKLIPFDKRSKRKASEEGKKGGKKSGEIRREKRRLKDCAEYLLSLPVADINRYNNMAQMGIIPENIDNRMLMVASLFAKSCTGDVNAAKELRSLIGEDKESPEEHDIQPIYNGIPAVALGKAYVDIYRSIKARDYRFYDFKGGRGSLKSSFCALAMIDEIEINNNFCGIAMRQVKDTLTDSVYAQLVWAIDELGLSEQYKCTSNPMRIKKISTGQVIYFRGGDDPMKIKSIKPPKGMHIGIVWFEEKDQFKGNEAIRNILQSVMRGGEDIIILSSYNTPISAQHFINKDARENNPKRIIHHSYYYDTPKEWLGMPFLEEAERLKEINEKAYRHEYLGEAVGTGGNVFENIKIEEITDDEIKNYEYIYNGVDWGYYPDPWAFVRCSYDASKRILYIFDEAFAQKKNNRETADIIYEKGLTPDDIVICDSAEPKSMADYAEYGLYVRGAEKGAGSVSYSMKWLQGLTKIVIDNKRCPKTAEEFLSYEYERSKDNEIISGYPDKNNHFIDAVRYSTNILWRQRGM